jgi:NAD(P)-dependent dehydrogenase (short-subunit alcohol dehydrogenase family)
MTSKVAIVTGAASGIGLATARRLLRGGWRIVGVDLAEDRVVKAVEPGDTGDDFVAVGADIGDPNAVEALYARSAEAFGRLDAVVNSAGISLVTDTRITDVTLEDFDRTVRVNLRGTFLMCRAAIEPLRAAGGGAIVNLGSVASVRGAGGTSYTATKHGIAGLSRAVAAHYAGDRIRCTTVAPGPTTTPMLAASKTKSSSASGGFPWALAGEADPDEVAALIEFLVSDSGRYLTGGVYPIDGGITQH